MHTSILKKCLEELEKEAPRKDYVIGMLETLISLDTGATPPIPARPVKGSIVPMPLAPAPQPKEEKDEGEILDALTRARIGDIAALSKKSTTEL